MAGVYSNISGVSVNVYENGISAFIDLGNFRCSFCEASEAERKKNISILYKRCHDAIN